MSHRFLRFALSLLFLLGIGNFATAAPEPEGFEGTVTGITAKLITIRSPQGTRVFHVEKAGVCGWPTKKKCVDVFKVGDKVIAYYFGDPAGKRTEPALNIFFADEEKVSAFQRGESAKTEPRK